MIDHRAGPPSRESTLVPRPLLPAAILFLVVPALVALAISLLMPWTPRTREMSAQAICARNLQAIGRARLNGDSSGGTVRCPNSPALNYVFLPPASAPADRDRPIVYEPLENHHEGGHVLFGDGRVRFLARPEYDEILGPWLAPASRAGP